MEIYCQETAGDLRATFGERPIIVLDKPSPLLWLLGAIVLLILLLTAPISACVADDPANRTLIGNRAVQRELHLSKEQQAKINLILAEIEKEIASKVKAAKGTKPDDDAASDSIVETIERSVLSKHEPSLMAVLDKDQAIRFWQIGAQASGPAVFNNNRTRRVLKLTREQQEAMAQRSDKMVDEIRRLAIDVDMDINQIKQNAELAKKRYAQAILDLLTAEQRRDFDELMGKPFDLELLGRSDGEKPRSLTFVFGLTGHNQFVLTNSLAVRRELGLTEAQSKQIKAIIKKADEDLTELRLRVLKGASVDFAEMAQEEKRRVVRAILDGAAKINIQANRRVLQILNDEQRDTLNKHLILLAGARAIESESVASWLKLSAEQKAAFAELTAEFEQNTAPQRVVREMSAFDQASFDKLLEKYEAAAQALLTAEQTKMLEGTKK